MTMIQHGYIIFVGNFPAFFQNVNLPPGISPGLEEPIYSVFQEVIFKLLLHEPEMTLIKISSRKIPLLVLKEACNLLYAGLI